MERPNLAELRSTVGIGNRLAPQAWVSYGKLQLVLRGFGFELGESHDNMIDVFRFETRTVGLLRRRPEVTKKRLGTVGYKDEGTEVSLKELKNMRRLCNLAEEDSAGSAAFYGDEAVIGALVSRDRTVLRRLAQT